MFESNRDITNLIKNSLQNEFDDEVKNLSNLDEALKEIAMGDYDLIIARDKVEDEQGITSKFVDMIESSNITTSLISIGIVEIEHESLVGSLPDKFNMSELISLIKNHFSGDEGNKQVSYIPIRLEVLELLQKSEFDLYSLLKRPGKEDQYRQKFSAGDEITDLDKLNSKGVKELFLNKGERLKFTGELNKQVSRKINIDFNDFSHVMRSGESVYRLARKLISEQGTNEISYRLINCLAEEMVGNLKKAKII